MIGSRRARSRALRICGSWLLMLGSAGWLAAQPQPSLDRSATLVSQASESSSMANQEGGQSIPLGLQPPRPVEPDADDASSGDADEMIAGDARAALPAASSTSVGSEDGVDLDHAEAFVRANSLYEEGRYGLAIELYEDLVQRGHGSGGVYFNLGNAYLRNGELGRAVACYLRSQALMPRDEDVEANLRFARKSTLDAVVPPSPAPALRTLFFWHYSLSRGELVRFAVVVNVLLWTLLALRLWRRSDWLRISTYFVLVLMLAFGGSLLAHTLRPERVAVVLPPVVEGLAGPGGDSVALFTLHTGTEVRVVEEREGWLRIRLPDGKSGWLPRDLAEVVAR